nr:copia protein [Tanacetum cinerariifolium]
MNKRKPNIKFFHLFGCRCYLLNDYDDVRKLKEKRDIGVFIRYSKESAAFIVYNKRTHKIHESVNVIFDEISEMTSKQFSLEPGLSNLNETRKSSNPSVSQVSETSKKDLEDLFQNIYDEYFDSSKLKKSLTTNVETSKNEGEVFHEVSESFQRESSSASTSHNVFNEHLEDAYFDARVESIFTTASSPIVSLQTPTPIITPFTIATITTSSYASIPLTTIPSTILENLPTFNSVFRFDERLRSLETTFSEYRQTNPFVDVVSTILDNFSNIPGIVNQYMHQQMPEAIREAVQTQTNRLQDSIQKENDKFLKTIDENMKKIIKGQVKSQVKEQVSRILPRIEESVNATLEAEVLTRSSHSLRTSYAVAADLLEMELKKILIDKMEGNKSIQRSYEQRNLYKALVEAYNADKTILDICGESTILKQRREDDDQEGPSAGSDRGSKRQREGGEHASVSTPSEPATGSAGRSTTGSQSRQLSASESAFAEEPVQTTCQMEELSHLVFETGAEDQPIIQTTQHPEWFSQPRRPPTPDCDWNKSVPAAQGNAQSWISTLAKQNDARSSFNELLDTPIDLSNFIMNRLDVDTLTPELLAGPTYELMRGSFYKATMDQLDWVNPEGQQYPHNLLQPLPLIPDNRGRSVIPFKHFINNDLEYLRGGALSRKYTTSVTKTKAADYGHIKWIEDLVPRAMWIQEPMSYDKHANS